jgi:hypothetical protein
VIVDPIPGGDILEQIASSGMSCKVTIIWANIALPNMKKRRKLCLECQLLYSID